MRIAVIGKNGQLAQRLAAVDSPHELVFLGRDVLDLAQPSTIPTAIEGAKADLIVNAAAYTAVDAAETDAGMANAVNAQGVDIAAGMADMLRLPFVHVSTDYVYAGDKTGPYVEDDPTDPQGVYGASKLEGERRAMRSNPRTTILRTAWVYAPEGKNFVKTMLRLADRDELGVVHDQRGSPTYAGDLAEAILTMAPALVEAKAGSDVYGIFHCAGGGEASWAELAEATFAHAASTGMIDGVPTVNRITTADYPTPAKRPANSVLDCTKLARVFGQAPRDWHSALTSALNAHPDAFLDR